MSQIDSEVNEVDLLLPFLHSGGLFHNTETLEELVFQYATQTINSDSMILHKSLMAIPERVKSHDSLTVSDTGGYCEHCDDSAVPVWQDLITGLLQCAIFWNRVWQGSLGHRQIPHHLSCSQCVTQWTSPMWRPAGT